MASDPRLIDYLHCDVRMKTTSENGDQDDNQHFLQQKFVGFEAQKALQASWASLTSAGGFHRWFVFPSAVQQ